VAGGVGPGFARQQPADRYPMIVAMREQLLAGSGDQRARWALKVLLNGILSTPAE
jgi:hypothetical protein